MNTKVQEALAVLGYTEEWIKYGFLKEQVALSQLDEYSSSSSKHSEHYRSLSFNAVLNSRATLNDDDIEHYVSIVALEKDAVLAKSALIRIVEWPGLSINQINMLKKHDVIEGFALRNHIEIIILRRKASEDRITAEEFRKYIDSRDGILHSILLKRDDLSQEQLAVLEKEGANRAVRNMARVRLHRKR